MKPEKAPYPGEHRNRAKTPQPEKDPATGQYVGSLANQGALTAEERHNVRKILCSEQAPLHLTQLATMAGVQLTRADRLSNLANFVEVELQRMGEVEMKFQPSPRGQGERFAGWAATKRLLSQLEKGLI
jgi:hypothetical protein